MIAIWACNSRGAADRPAARAAACICLRNVWDACTRCVFLVPGLVRRSRHGACAYVRGQPAMRMHIPASRLGVFPGAARLLFRTYGDVRAHFRFRRHCSSLDTRGYMGLCLRAFRNVPAHFRPVPAGPWASRHRRVSGHPAHILGRPRALRPSQMRLYVLSHFYVSGSIAAAGTLAGCIGEAFAHIKMSWHIPGVDGWRFCAII